MSEKQTKRLRRLRRLAATGGPELLLEAYKRFGKDEEATLKWLARTMREVATNPSANMRDLLPQPSGQATVLGKENGAPPTA